MSYFATHYILWRQKRIETILNYYGEQFFSGKTLLELGCGYGDIGAVFSRYGAKVTCAEGRPEHIQVARNRYPQIEFVQVDLDNQWPFEQFDIILHLGVLYHLASPDPTIVNACKTAKHIVLESEICDSSDPFLYKEGKEGGFDQALNEWGCHPTRAYVERLLTECGVRYTMLTSDSANAHFHKYDWPEKNTGKCEIGQRRMWFIESK